MRLSLQPLANAIARLEEAIRLSNAEPDNLLLRDGLIQRFEFTYELTFNSLKRQIQQSASSHEAVSRLDFAELIRRGWEMGLLNEEVSAWREFRQKRNLTSHTYEEANALEVCALIPRFLAEAKRLYGELQKRHAYDAPH